MLVIVANREDRNQKQSDLVCTVGLDLFRRELVLEILGCLSYLFLLG